MNCGLETAEPINSFALVSYIPGQLGEFITRLREDLVAGCVAQSHVSILTPRPLHITREAASQQVRAGLAPFSAFELELPRIRVFEQTSVVFCEVGIGRDQLFVLHDALNTNGLAFDEPFDYHPHVTLAQGMPPDLLPQVYEMAVRRWKESAPSTSAMIESATFVQNTDKNLWLDLEEYELRGAAAVPVG